MGVDCKDVDYEEEVVVCVDRIEEDGESCVERLDCIVLDEGSVLKEVSVPSDDDCISGLLSETTGLKIDEFYHHLPYLQLYHISGSAVTSMIKIKTNSVLGSCSYSTLLCSYCSLDCSF
ncbi:MAG: hypothetical protein EZS28_026351 [Streblomastix strix]|uniref:Uncharacterized protein n=1 Tax=Streblomastix strix TaxID=222440 RepID=A0A5J4V6S7_9EUKA|nr:MAG: hypothetical protein EZS28_026351 [Streblomastix strix]